MKKEFDASKLENTGWRLFQKWFQDYYHNKFPELSNEYKDKAIAYVIENNAKIFTKDFVLKENLCHKCGTCCITIGCPNFDKKTKLCPIHDNQNSIICYEYPYSDVGFVFTMNCGYVRDIFRIYMDMYFKKAIELAKKKRCDDGKET